MRTETSDALCAAVEQVNVSEVRRLLVAGCNPNAVRSSAEEEEEYQPDRPLKMVMFRISDCLLDNSQLDALNTIAELLIAHGADPGPAMSIAESRYSKYPGTDATTWKAWHTVAAAASPYMIAQRALIDLQSTRATMLSKPVKRPTSAAEVRAIMRHYADRINLNVRGIKVVHVAGTKGKGSVCAMTESILRAHGYRTGLFTSPHLIDYRERIRINGRPISPLKFASHFWSVLRALRRTSKQTNNNARSGSSEDDDDDDVAVVPPIPSFFRFLTLFAMHAFVAENVDVIILEVGIGGRLDSTNYLLPEEVTVTGVTTLDYDHCELLGDTIELIAAEKAGIFKRGVPAVSIASQTASAMEVLRAAAADVGAPFEVAAPIHDDVSLGLAGAFQRGNAAVAVRLSAFALREDRNSTSERGGMASSSSSSSEGGCTATLSLPDATLRGLESCRWAGRAQRILGDERRFGPRLDVRIFLDGAHTPMSAHCCAEWYRSQSLSTVLDHAGGGDGADSLEGGPSASASSSSSSSPLPVLRLLIFNCGSKRNPIELLQPFVGLFNAAIFCPPDFDKPSAKGDPLGVDFLRTILRDDPTALDAAVSQLHEKEAAALALAEDAGAADRFDASKIACLWQHRLAAVWSALHRDAAEPEDDCNAHVLTTTSVNAALQACKDFGERSCLSSRKSRKQPSNMDTCSIEEEQPHSSHRRAVVEILITGSIYLVGSALNALGWSEEDGSVGDDS